ncbi:MAG: MBL fold metallo-hydrolase [Hyphomicrobiales bacterium]|nr:MBL fold metallo-hydrolase [Hyphomicrobiales bacterium]MCP4999518.1 MBL fold metallo-hydrolase [Hyphomicrobiales bacterium]
MAQLKMATIASAIGIILSTSGALAQDAHDEMFAKMPPVAAGPAIDREKGYVVEELGRGLYHLNDGVYQMMFVTTGGGVIVVDAPPNTGKNILAAISSVTNEPITHVIYSHSHKDHIGAAALFPDDAVIIAHEDTAAHLAGKNDPDRPVPNKTFTDGMTLEVGCQKLQLDYHGVNHAPGNLYIYAPEQKVLMLVDIVFPGWTPFPDLALAESVDGFLEAHNLILGYDFEHFIGGHLNRGGTRQDVETQQAYFADMVQAAGKANGTMDFNAA